MWPFIENNEGLPCILAKDLSTGFVYELAFYWLVSDIKNARGIYWVTETFINYRILSNRSPPPIFSLNNVKVSDNSFLVGGISLRFDRLLQ